jgi:hypothetical protein
MSNAVKFSVKYITGGFNEALPEAQKVTNYILTIPATRSRVKRLFSFLEQIKANFRSLAQLHRVLGLQYQLKGDF